MLLTLFLINLQDPNQQLQMYLIDFVQINSLDYLLTLIDVFDLQNHELLFEHLNQYQLMVCHLYEFVIYKLKYSIKNLEHFYLNYLLDNEKSACR